MKYNAFISYSHSADTKLAPKLQKGLEQFAKPWYKRRNLNVFRDEGSLSASPHLWKNLQQNIADSEHFIFLASPQAAASKWVRMEIDEFLKNKPTEKIIIVMTDGELKWDYEKNKVVEGPKNSLPPNLAEKFDAEPFYIDFRSSVDDANLSFDDPILKKELLKVAAHLHGMEPKNLAGEAVRQHKKTMRIRNTAITMLTLLLIAVGITAWFAHDQRMEAEGNLLISEAQREKNATKAIGFAIDAYQKKEKPEILEKAAELYSNAILYDQILLKEEVNPPEKIAFMKTGDRFITYHTPNREDLERQFGNMAKAEPIDGQDNEFMYYHIWDLDGNQLSSFDMDNIEVYKDSVVGDFFNEEPKTAQLWVDYENAESLMYLRNGEDTLAEYADSGNNTLLKSTFLSPDQRKIVSIWNNNEIHLTNAMTGFKLICETGKQRDLTAQQVYSKTDYVTDAKMIAFSERGDRFLYVAEEDIQLWDLSNHEMLNAFQLNNNVECVFFDESGQIVQKYPEVSMKSVVDRDTLLFKMGPNSCKEPNQKYYANKFGLFGIKSSGNVRDITTEPAVEESADFIAIKSDSTLLSVVSASKMEMYTNPSFGAEKLNLGEPLTTLTRDVERDNVMSIHMSNSGDFLMATVIKSNEASAYFCELWDIESGILLRSFGPFDEYPSWVDFSPEDDQLLIGTRYFVGIWNRPRTIKEVIDERKQE